MTRYAHGTLGAVTAVLLCALVGCAGGGDAPGTPGDSTRPKRSCPPFSSGSAPPGSPTATQPGTGSPGDSQTHSADPHRDCVIESGVPNMPVDP
ncbi:hypothetical protein ACFW9N_23995 [Streptomyces sp. NPDC059496]|uniref:hypothetical protein n=1 Tax=Streptomyces sp. NPDC059496 TaxID=3346851 RepID=UPI0036B45A9B